MYATAADAPFKTVDTFIFSEADEDFQLDGYCPECMDEHDSRNAIHGCGFNAPQMAIIHSIKMRTEQTEDDLESLPF